MYTKGFLEEAEDHTDGVERQNRVSSPQKTCTFSRLHPGTSSPFPIAVTCLQEMHPAGSPGRPGVLSNVRVCQTLGREGTHRCVAPGHFSN